uniref:RNA helicase n=1 Tax=Panagrolaimus sp. PS1159 TaxID=55785 RepID=A0AC35GSC9_9BILA
MSDNSGANFQLHLDEDCEFEPLEEYNDVGYPMGLIDNLRQAGFAKPTFLQQTILECMGNKRCLVGNVPHNRDAQVAYVSYAVFECIKAKQVGKYKPDEYKPFA